METLNIRSCNSNGICCSFHDIGTGYLHEKTCTNVLVIAQKNPRYYIRLLRGWWYKKDLEKVVFWNSYSWTLRGNFSTSHRGYCYNCSFAGKFRLRDRILCWACPVLSTVSPREVSGVTLPEWKNWEMRLEELSMPDEDGSALSMYKWISSLMSSLWNRQAGLLSPDEHE